MGKDQMRAISVQSVQENIFPFLVFSLFLVIIE